MSRIVEHVEYVLFKAILFFCLDYQYYMYWYFKDIGIFYSHYTPHKHSLGGYIGIGLFVRTNFHIFCPISTKLCGI